MTLTSAFLCMALNVYFESRGEPELGMKLVAQTTLNRAKHNESEVCNAVLAPRQFSWTSVKLDGKRLNPQHQPTDLSKWSASQQISERALIGALHLDQKWRGVTHFHNLQVKPVWTTHKDMKYLGRVGNHHFYAYKP